MNDEVEVLWVTDPNDPDSDDDGLTDFFEFWNCTYGEDEDECTNPLQPDTDDDGINDYDEINNCIYGSFRNLFVKLYLRN